MPCREERVRADGVCAAGRERVINKMKLMRILWVISVAGCVGCDAVVSGDDDGKGETAPESGERIIPIGEEFFAGSSWSDEVLTARPRFEAGSVVQSSNADDARRTVDRVSVSRSGNALVVRIEEVDRSEHVRLAIADALDTKAVNEGSRHILETDVGDNSIAYAVIYDLDDERFEMVLGHWIREYQDGRTDGGVFTASAACELERVSRSNVQNYAGGEGGHCQCCGAQLRADDGIVSVGHESSLCQLRDRISACRCARSRR